MNIEELEQNIGYKFKNKELLKTALTHTSYAHEKKVESNEKLEFLGDSILEFVTSNYLYNNYRKLKEGEMTKVRASVVCESSLYQVALKHNFSDFLKLGKSEIACKGNKKPAILADSVEAAVRSISEPTKGKIEEMVNNIIKDKLYSGQLDNCDLTLKDLEKIRKCFLKTLNGIYHQRIEYPTEKKVKNS